MVKRRLLDPSEFSAFEFTRQISAIRNMLDFNDYRHQSIDFQHPPPSTTVRSGA
jgi:hypothetical protein